MRSANKPKLAEALSNLQLVEVEVPQEGAKYVLDGGALLQKIQWEIKKTYKPISEAYVSFIKKNFGRDAVIVLTAIQMNHRPKTKRMCNGQKHLAPVTDFNEDVVLNKQKFLNLLK